jgi:hypothetical protein
MKKPRRKTAGAAIITLRARKGRCDLYRKARDVAVTEITDNAGNFGKAHSPEATASL